MLDNSPDTVVEDSLALVKGFYDKFGLRPAPEAVAALILNQAPKVFKAGKDLDDEDPESVADYLRAITDHAFYVGGMVLATKGRSVSHPIAATEERASAAAAAIGLGRVMTIGIACWEPAIYEKVIAEAFRRVATSNMTRSHDIGPDLKVAKGDDFIAPDLTDLAKELIASAA